MKEAWKQLLRNIKDRWAELLTYYREPVPAPSRNAIVNHLLGGKW